MTPRDTINIVRWVACGAVLLGLAAEAGAGQSVRDRYVSALTQERALRTPTTEEAPPTLAGIRTLVRRYEAIVARYPRSGYSDNALWQAAGLALEAFDRFGNEEDRQKGLRLLRALVREYPSSSLVTFVDERIRQFESVREPKTLRAIRRRVLSDVLRVTVELDAEVRFHEERLADPPRVFVDLERTRTVPELQDATLSFDDDAVREIRLGRHPNDRTRVVIDLTRGARYSVFTLYNPFRIVIDFERVSPTPSPMLAGAVDSETVPSTASPSSPEPSPVAEPLLPIAAAPSGPVSLPTPAAPVTNLDGGFSLARQLGLSVSRVVIDPGHGGHDPGAQASGIAEAETVLDVARRLEQLLLKEPGIEVVLTRREDVFVPLEERTAIANREEADLFLSIHANASRNRSANGIETYFLNFATSPDAEAVAARENSASEQDMRKLSDIVRAITLNTKIDESRELAAIVQAAIVRSLRPSNPRARNLGVKQAPFVVLIGASMPSVLTEVSFLTNAREGGLLKKPTYRQEIAEALRDAVLQYRQTLKSIPVAAKP